ncbi:unnamed protein product [Paramecium primaurelia]|uniref:Transmembrane protein n=1 Tax=Paramecium primaurelia TaxID=5886 RepID=A0A8S1MTR6_PARPR|nr:unnamed protein product [Paramecium primaurelia]
MPYFQIQIQIVNLSFKLDTMNNRNNVIDVETHVKHVQIKQYVKNVFCQSEKQLNYLFFLFFLKYMIILINQVKKQIKYSSPQSISNL